MRWSRLPTSRVWMAVEEKAVARAHDVDHGAGHFVLEAPARCPPRIASEVLPYLAALVEQGGP